MGSLARGALVVIEGVDRSGKSTQCRNLVKGLIEKGIKSELISFPDRTTPTGKVISEYLKNSDFKLGDHAIHLLFTANRWENMEKMKRLLLDGVTLIVDRYSYSGIAFSAAKGMDIDWCMQPENGLLKPDQVFMLSLPIQQLLDRPGFGNERYEKTAIQTKVANIFHEMCQHSDNWTEINANGSIEDVHNMLLSKTLNLIKDSRSKSLEYLNFNL